MTETADENAGEADLHYVTGVADVRESERVITEIRGREVSVFHVDGEFHALLNYCPHQGGPLCEGVVTGCLGVDQNFELEYSREGEIVSCPWHGWEFDIKTGEHLSKTGYMVPKYDVVVRDEKVYLSTG